MFDILSVEFYVSHSVCKFLHLTFSLWGSSFEILRITIIILRFYAYMWLYIRPVFDIQSVGFYIWQSVCGFLLLRFCILSFMFDILCLQMWFYI